MRMIDDVASVEYGVAWVGILEIAETEPRPGFGACHGHSRNKHLPPVSIGIRILKSFPQLRPAHYGCEGQATDDQQRSEHATDSPGGPNAAPGRKKQDGGARENHENGPGARRARDDRGNHRTSHGRTEEHLPTIRQRFIQNDRQNEFDEGRVMVPAYEWSEDILRVFRLK